MYLLPNSMKTYLILFVSLRSITGIFSQYPYIYDAYLFPSNPANTDSVFLISKVGLNTQGYLLESTVDISGNTINVQNCYRESPLFATIYAFDTTFIGIHTNGNYNVIFTAYSSSASNPSCDYKDSNQVFLDLTVEIHEITVLTNRKLIKQIDLSGRESNDVPNSILIRFYNDGVIERVLMTE